MSGSRYALKDGLRRSRGARRRVYPRKVGVPPVENELRALQAPRRSLDRRSESADGCSVARARVRHVCEPAQRLAVPDSTRRWSAPGLRARLPQHVGLLEEASDHLHGSLCG